MPSNKNENILQANKSSLHSLLLVANRLVEIHPNMDVDTFRAFLGIAIAGEISVGDIGANLGWSKSKASQRSYLLAEGRVTDTQDVPGLGLCETVANPNDNRFKLLTLSPLGRQVANQLCGFIKE